MIPRADAEMSWLGCTTGLRTYDATHTVVVTRTRLAHKWRPRIACAPVPPEARVVVESALLNSVEATRTLIMPLCTAVIGFATAYARMDPTRPAHPRPILLNHVLEVRRLQRGEHLVRTYTGMYVGRAAPQDNVSENAIAVQTDSTGTGMSQLTATAPVGKVEQPHILDQIHTRAVVYGSLMVDDVLGNAGKGIHECVLFASLAIQSCARKQAEVAMQQGYSSSGSDDNSVPGGSLSSSNDDRESVDQRQAVNFIPTDYPVMIWVAENLVKPGFIDIVASNYKQMFNAFGIPAVTVLYYRMKCTAREGEYTHLFVAVDAHERVIRVPSARLALMTATIDPVEMTKYGGSITSDPLAPLLLKADDVRLNRFPAVFGFKTAKGDKALFDRKPELTALRRDGYIGLTFLPIPGVDHRVQLMTEIASLWGFSLASWDKRWPDLLVLRNDTAERHDLGGVPDETWLMHALMRVQEDHLPIVEVDGLWMGSIPRTSESRARIMYAVLDWVRLRALPYITARTFHCYVRRDLSLVVALGCIKDRMELVEFLEAYPFDVLTTQKITGELDATKVVFAQPRSSSAVIALRDTGDDTWIVVSLGPSPRMPSTGGNLESTLRKYFSGPACESGVGGRSLSPAEIARLPLEKLVKVVRVAECDAASGGQCLVVNSGSTASGASISHRAYRAAIRSHKMRTHNVIGVYRLGPFASPFFAFDVHQYIPPPDATSRYRPVIHEINLTPDQGATEDGLLKKLVGTVWRLAVHEEETPTASASEIDVIQVATDRDPSEVRALLFKAWKTGHMIGTWCRVMLTHRESLSVAVAGGTVDPLLAHAGDSIVDGNRWLNVAQRGISECSPHH